MHSLIMTGTELVFLLCFSHLCLMLLAIFCYIICLRVPCTFESKLMPPWWNLQQRNICKDDWNCLEEKLMKDDFHRNCCIIPSCSCLEDAKLMKDDFHRNCCIIPSCSCLEDEILHFLQWISTSIKI